MDKILVEMEESAGTVSWRCSCVKFAKLCAKLFQNLHTIYREIPMLESLFNEVSGRETCNFVKS